MIALTHGIGKHIPPSQPDESPRLLLGGTIFFFVSVYVRKAVYVSKE